MFSYKGLGGCFRDPDPIISHLMPRADEKEEKTMTEKSFEFIKEIRSRHSSGSIIITGGSRTDVDRVIRILREAFEDDEIAVMCKYGGVEVRIEERNDGIAGVYERKRDGILIPRIGLIPNARDDQIVHEFVHHLRTVDNRRKGITRTAHPADIRGGLIESDEYWDNLYDFKNIEESATTAETTARRRSFDKVSNYYSKVPHNEPRSNDPKLLYMDDRILLAGTEDEDLRGDEATDAVNDKFDRTHISNAKIFSDQVDRNAKESWDHLRENGLIRTHRKQKKK